MFEVFWNCMTTIFIHERWRWNFSYMKRICEKSPLKILILKIELGKIVLKTCILEHHLFTKKDKLAHETILLDVNFMLHHLVHAKFAKDSWSNLCATFGKKICWLQIPTKSRAIQS